MATDDFHIPLPAGKILPDLRGSGQANTEDTPDWLMILCPNCNSDNVVSISPVFNPNECYDSVLNKPTKGLWFCISCQDSWRYGFDPDRIDEWIERNLADIRRRNEQSQLAEDPHQGTPMDYDTEAPVQLLPMPKAFHSQRDIPYPQD
ncbi:hypothetical protein LCGC14_0408860 [marine sediment metagenome]|uniref:Uncharacterized protein n=1 Tax=marine sediment metagenome TaxID=412755 RepID=A0A0F9T075_9ZZZZ